MFSLTGHPAGCCAFSLPLMPVIDDDIEPKEGDCAVCMNCGTILRYTPQAFLPLEPNELLMLIADEKRWRPVTELLASIGHYKRAA